MPDLLDDAADLGNFTHNSDAAEDLNPSAQGRLRSFVERLERLLEDAAAVRQDMKEVRQEAKSEGFDTPTINRVIKIRAMDRAKRQEQEALLDLYLASLGEI